MGDDTIQNILTYSELLEDHAECNEISPNGSCFNISTQDLSSRIITIRDYIDSNLNSPVTSTKIVSNINSSYKKKSTSSTDSNLDRSSISSVEDTQTTDLLSRICYKIDELELLFHKEKMSNLNNLKHLQAEINNLQVKNKKLRGDNFYLYDQMYDIDCRVIDSEQYPRRHNLIITGIPETVKQYQLEKTVIEIIKSIGLNISSYEVVGCHRLHKNINSKYPAKTIIRFTNRKVVEYCIKNLDNLINIKKQLRMNLRFYENLCDSNERVFNWCRELKKYGLLNDYFVRNGFIKIVIDEGDKPMKIHHPDDLFHKFQDYFDHIDICEL